jgi:hypothetical protein
MLLGLLAALVASQCWGPRACRLLTSRGMGMSMFVVEIRGRLIDDATGRPLAGMGVLALSGTASATETETLEGFAWRNGAARAAQAGGPAIDERNAPFAHDPEQHGLIESDGRFLVRITRMT